MACPLYSIRVTRHAVTVEKRTIDVEPFLEQRQPVSLVDDSRGEVLGAGAERHDDGHPARRHYGERGELLGQNDGVPNRGQHQNARRRGHFGGERNVGRIEASPCRARRRYGSATDRMPPPFELAR